MWAEFDTTDQIRTLTATSLNPLDTQQYRRKLKVDVSAVVMMQTVPIKPVRRFSRGKQALGNAQCYALFPTQALQPLLVLFIK